MLTLLFVACLLAGLGIKLWLARRQISHITHHRNQVPTEFASRITLASHQRAADYTIARLKFTLLEGLFSTVVLIGLTLLGGLYALDRGLATLTANDVTRQLSLLIIVAFILAGLALPFKIWRQFRIEAHFGFNRMTPKLFVTDTIKGIVLSTIIGLPLACLILWLMTQAGSLWWIWAFGVWATFNLLALWLFPSLIAPLFNRFTPLADTDLVHRIQQLAQRCGFTIQSIWVMDGSRRSGHGNAYFTGFGKSRRIVFFDTLLARLNHAEIEAVLAHELGHFVHRHILKRLVVSLGLAFGFFALLGGLADQTWFYTQLGVVPHAAGHNEAMALLLFFLIMPIFTFPFTPIGNGYSRAHEFQADRYATQQSSAPALISALVKLYDNNAATLTPDPLYSAFYDSHPPATVRIHHLLAANHDAK